MQLQAVARNVLAPLPLEEVQQLAAVFDRVKAEYVEPVDEKKLISDAIAGNRSGAGSVGEMEAAPTGCGGALDSTGSGSDAAEHPARATTAAVAMVAAATEDRLTRPPARHAKPRTYSCRC